MTIDFSNDKLLGSSQWCSSDDILGEYKTSRARVCVTVAMMTTGWDCPNILNLALMRPIFSPTEFIQIKGRGTRIYDFECKYKTALGQEVLKVSKTTFKLFDFFAVCEYFEEKYNYDQVLRLPNQGTIELPTDPLFAPPKPKRDGYDYQDKDYIANIQETYIGVEGMKVDRMFFQEFETTVKQDAEILNAIEEGNIESAMGLTLDRYLNKPKEFYTVEKLRKSLKIDRKVTLREILEQIFYGNTIKGKEELIIDEFEKFIATVPLDEMNDIEAIRYYFYAYITDPQVRKIIDNQDYTELNYNPSFGIDDFTRVNDSMRYFVPQYVKTYISLEKFSNA